MPRAPQKGDQVVGIAYVSDSCLSHNDFFTKVGRS